jgi:hypothetical protein
MKTIELTLNEYEEQALREFVAIGNTFSDLSPKVESARIILNRILSRIDEQEAITEVEKEKQ